jgi:hypothetical protein
MAFDLSLRSAFQRSFEVAGQANRGSFGRHQAHFCANQDCWADAWPAT